MIRFVWLITLLSIVASCATQRDVTTASPSTRDDANISSMEKKKAGLDTKRENATATKNEIGAYRANALRKKYAKKLGVTDETTLDNAALLAFIDEWYGVPYKYAGRDKNGVDCSGFTCTLYHD